jgi:peroxisomal enoyl-CoA hydratase 2
MSSPGAGFEYPAKEVSWLKRDVLLFANSIGATADELHFLYVNLLNLCLIFSLK